MARAYDFILRRHPRNGLQEKIKKICLVRYMILITWSMVQASWYYFRTSLSSFTKSEIVSRYQMRQSVLSEWKIHRIVYEKYHIFKI